MKDDRMILAIDPGHVRTAYVVYDPKNETISEHGIIENEKFLYEEIPQMYYLASYRNGRRIKAVIEMIAGYGMPVGKEIFETCVFIGRIWERLEIPKEFVYRKDVKLHLCGTNRAKDSNIRQALIDRFGAPGTKKAPGRTYGLRADEWAALACAVFYGDTHGKA